MASTRTMMMEEVLERSDVTNTKVTIVGVGQVGMAAAFHINIMGSCSELALVDVVEEKLRGEMLDLQHGQAFTRRIKVKAGTDYAVSAGSKICVVTAGARQHEGESRLSLVQRNVNIFKHIIPQLVKHSPDAILVIVSNPVDILTYVAWKISGFPKHRVIGTGTMVDSSRFRFLISEKLGVASQNCHGYIIGEHGDSSVAVWSGVNIGGVRLKDLNPDVGTDRDTENWSQIHKEVVESAYSIIKLKGYTSWCIGTAVGSLVKAILSNAMTTYALSTLVTGLHGIDKEVFLSLPCVVGVNGVTNIFRQTLDEEERKKLHTSANTMYDITKEIEF